MPPGKPAGAELEGSEDLGSRTDYLKAAVFLEEEKFKLLKVSSGREPQSYRRVAQGVLSGVTLSTSGN